MTSEGSPALTRRPLAARIPIRGARPAWIARPLLPSKLHALLPLAIFGAWAFSIRSVNLADMTDVGLISVLPASTIALLFLLTVSFCLSLARRPPGTIVPLVHVIALVVMLYGITSFLESTPRFGVAWKLVGIVDFISGHRAVTPPADAFFNWPGFLALGSLITEAAGYRTALAIAGWGPIVFNLLWLAPLSVIFRWVSDDPRVTWLGLWAFCSTNWIGQDYMSNQAVAYTLFLALLATMLTWFTPRPSQIARAVTLRSLAQAVDPRTLWSRWHPSTDYRHPTLQPQERRLILGPGRELVVSRRTQAPVYQRVLMLVLIVAMYGAVVTGHQLTPFPAFLVTCGLAVFAGLQIRLLPLIMAVLLAAWVAYMTTNYLAGHSSQVLGAVGQLSQNLTTSVSTRFVGSSGHELVVKIRTATTLATLLVGTAGALRRLRAGRIDTAMYVVAGAAFLLPGLQAYGGEVVLRVALFSLPAVSFFMATFAFPTTTAGRSWLATATIAIIACGLLGAFQYARYGNERFDAFTKGDLATVRAFYRLAPRGSIIYAGDVNVPWQYRDYTGYSYRFVTDLSTWNARRPSLLAVASQVRNVLASSRGGYVIITRSMKIYEEVNENRPHVLDRLIAGLRLLPDVREVYRNPDGDLFYVAPARVAR